MSQKILVAEDEMELRELYVDIIKNAGYEVDGAEAGDEALKKIQSGVFDLVLLDIMMPKISGLEILDEIKKTPPAGKKPVILAWSNLSHDPAVQKALQNGASAFLVKADYAPDQILQEIKKYLGGAATPPPPTTSLPATPPAAK